MGLLGKVGKKEHVAIVGMLGVLSFLKCFVGLEKHWVHRLKQSLCKFNLHKQYLLSWSPSSATDLGNTTRILYSHR